ncbi:MAG TPA: hypothetical protein PK156_13780 [Polyangium sp.]|nr:hypothetical protein [Polyangium sp.]
MTRVERDRDAIFAELRRLGHPDVLKLIEDAGEASIQRPELLLSYGALAQFPIERSSQPPLEIRESL